MFPLNLVECSIFDQNHLVGEVSPKAFPANLDDSYRQAHLQLVKQQRQLALLYKNIS